MRTTRPIKWVAHVYIPQDNTGDPTPDKMYPAITRIMNEVGFNGCLQAQCSPSGNYRHDDLLVLRSGAIVIRTGTQGTIIAESHLEVERIAKKMGVKLLSNKEAWPLRNPESYCSTHGFEEEGRDGKQAPKE